MFAAMCLVDPPDNQPEPTPPTLPPYEPDPELPSFVRTPIIPPLYCFVRHPVSIRFGYSDCAYCGEESYTMYRCYVGGVGQTWVCVDCNTWYSNNRL